MTMKKLNGNQEVCPRPYSSPYVNQLLGPRHKMQVYHNIKWPGIQLEVCLVRVTDKLEKIQKLVVKMEASNKCND